MIRAGWTLALAAALATSMAASAKPVEESDVVSGKVKLDPTKGYILVSGTQRQQGIFLRMPDDETRKKYEEDRQKAFAKAQRRYASDLAAWNAEVQNGQRGSTASEQPAMPKIETFSIDPIELRDAESFGPFFVYSKSQTVTYLNEVKPGTWIWYGPMFMGANGSAMGTCLCMGTVRFEVKPGVITDLGTSLQDAPHWDEDMDVARLKLKETNAKRVADGKEPLKAFAHGEVKYGLPASLQNWPSARAELYANPKLNNYFGADGLARGADPGSAVLSSRHHHRRANWPGDRQSDHCESRQNQEVSEVRQRHPARSG